jgi:hypothetical protein
MKQPFLPCQGLFWSALARALLPRAHIWLIALALGDLLALKSWTPALATLPLPEGVIVRLVAQDDLDGDSLPDRTNIHCDFGTGNDLVQVYDGAGNMQASLDWQQATDYEDDTWIFDASDDGEADLVIAFHHDGEALVAELYDDRDADGKVSYSAAGGRVRVTEPGGPTVRVVAADGWWQRDNRTNYNLHLEIDGAVRASFNSPVVRYRSVSPETLLSMADKHLDVTILVRDVDNDGRPDYDFRQVLSTPAVYTAYGTELAVNARDNEVPIEDFLFWPYLGGLTDYVKPSGGSMPPIQIDWAAAHISAVAEFVASRGGDSNWFVYSSKRFGADDAVYANFENPFAFYDLANDLDGVPELAARSEYYGPFDLSFLSGAYSQAIESIRYSWDQDNDGAWDFKVDLIGRNPITEVVTFPEFAVQTVPYEAFPDWIVDHRWDTGVFVAVEGTPYFSSEGIYEGFARPWRDLYVTGRTSSPGLQQAQNVRQGLRLEYTPELDGQSWLYFSPVDHKLHLRSAQGGVWNLDDALRVRYDDADNDGYLDRWAVTSEPPYATEAEAGTSGGRETGKTAPGKAVAFLQVADGMLIYADSGQVRLVRTVVEPSLFEMLPPRDHDEWSVLGEQLDRYGADFAPDGLLEMATQFQGPTTHIQGATLTDFRLTEDGFRLVLELQRGSQVMDDANSLNVTEQADGSYLVTYDGEFQIRTLTPPHLTVPEGGIAGEPSSPQQGSWATIRVVVRNSGLQDATLVPIAVYAVQGEGEPSLVGEEDLFVPAEGESVLELAWWPMEAGEWTIWVDAETAGAVPAGIDLGTMSSLQLDVDPALVSDMFEPFAWPDEQHLTLPVVSLLVAGGLAAVSCSLIVLIRAKG